MRSPADAAPSYLYLPELGAPGATVALPPGEGHYLVRVCRARAGDRATATDGRGAVAVLRVTTIGKSVEAVVESLERAERSRRAWVWCGPPEGERADWLVEKLSELGVEVWQPLHCERGRWARGDGRGVRWRRLAVAAMRQARRRFVMEVRPPLELGEALEQVPPQASRWLASAEGTRAPAAAGGELAVAAVGPAGGFTRVEEGWFRERGFAPICLSDGRLRSETAALAWAAWWASQ
jgi:16S rRNA (uracil1498-N3)-methyltransferase